jgi:hypothetical protein
MQRPPIPACKAAHARTADLPRGNALLAMIVKLMRRKHQTLDDPEYRNHPN